MEATTQCEACNDETTIADAHFEKAGPVTLAFCEDCSSPSRAQELGLRR